MDEKILTAIKNFGGQAETWEIANKIGMVGRTPTVLRAAKGMEAEGKIKQSQTSGNIIWTKA